MSKNTTPTVSLGVPVDSVPDTGKKSSTNGPAEYWLQVVAGCKLYPGKFIPVNISGLTENRLRSIPGAIRKGKLAAFREGQWEAYYRQGQLYISYQGESQATPLKVAV